MSALRLDGKVLSASQHEPLRARAHAAEVSLGRQVGLGVLLVGDDGPSSLYVRNKARAAARLGMASFITKLPADSTQAQIEAAVVRLNQDPLIDAFLVQLPLPAGIDADKVLALIHPSRDADGLTAQNVGLLASGRPLVVPCTPAGCLRLIALHRPSLVGLDAVVVGRSAIVGRPMAQALLAADATVTVCHAHTQNLAEHVRRADILVAATGVPHLIAGAWIKPGATVIDVGLRRVILADGTAVLMGDVEPVVANERAGALTPVPGGVGPMTIAMLMANTLSAAERKLVLERV